MKPLASTLPRATDDSDERRSHRALLTAVHPRDVVWQVSLDDRAVEVGRAASELAPALDHATVSRSHFAIELDHDTHGLVDRGGRNGVRLDGALVPTGGRVPLEDGAVVGVGDVLLVYERAAHDVAAASSVWRDRIPGDSVAVQRLRSAVARTSADPSPVLLIGETGTGKEWIAREVHRLSGCKGELVAVNCAALSEQLIESQLFGHVKGAFTGATSDSPGLFRAAAGGTLFLDEIGELPEGLQAKLLRALQEREVQPVGSARVVKVDARVIAATNRDLEREVEARRFRRDLYARLCLFEIRLPSLSERRLDILPWIHRLRRAFREQRGLTGNAALAFTPDAAETVLLHDWPDNLRGLDRLVHHLEIHGTPGQVYRRDQLPAWLRRREGVEPLASSPDSTTSIAKRRKAPSHEQLRALHDQLEGNIAAIARHFDCDRRQIYRWLDGAGIRRREE